MIAQYMATVLDSSSLCKLALGTTLGLFYYTGEKKITTYHCTEEMNID